MGGGNRARGARAGWVRRRASVRLLSKPEALVRAQASLSYSLQPASSGWRWQLIDPAGQTVASGEADTQAQAALQVERALSESSSRQA
jgi:hypothetical protein